MKYVVVLVYIALVSASCGNKTGKNSDSGVPDSTNTASQLEVLTAKINANPNDPDLYFDRAKYYYDNKMAQPGLSDIRKAISIDSAYSPFHVLFADLLYATRNIDSARTEIQTAIRLDPKNIPALTKMGEIQYMLGQYAEAFKYLDDALRLDPTKAEIYFLKGRCFLEQNREDLAISSFLTAIEQDPDYFDAYIQLGILYTLRKDPVAIEYLRNAILIRPNEVEGYYNLGYYLQEAGRGKEAIKVYTDLLAIDPQNGPALHNIGWVHLYINRNAEAALEYFNKAVLADNKMVNAYYHRGYCYELLNDKQAAKADYTNALTLEPNFQLAKDRLKKVQ